MRLCSVKTGSCSARIALCKSQMPLCSDQIPSATVQNALLEPVNAVKLTEWQTAFHTERIGSGKEEAKNGDTPKPPTP